MAAAGGRGGGDRTHIRLDPAVDGVVEALEHGWERVALVLADRDQPLGLGRAVVADAVRCDQAWCRDLGATQPKVRQSARIV